MNNKSKFYFLFSKLDEKQIPIWYKTCIQSILLILSLLCCGMIIKYCGNINSIFSFVDLCLLAFAIGFSYFYIVLAIKNVLFLENKVKTLHCIALTIFFVLYSVITKYYWNSAIFKDSSGFYDFNIFMLTGVILIAALTISMWISLYKKQI